MSPHLPERPNLEQLKKQAKTLLHDAHRGDTAARNRFSVQAAFAHLSDPDAVSSLALHDAQSVIAREYGFPSWNALRDEVSARTLTFNDAVDEFIRCATGGIPDRALRLLDLHPAIASATLQTALVVGDASSVEERLRTSPALATQPGGPHQWEPLLYVCHTCLHHNGGPARVEDLVTIAARLCALGANPNAEYHWNWHPELPRTALWAALCVIRHLPLADVLLAAGADPTDGVSAHIAGGGGNVAALELLYRFGMDLNGRVDGVPPLVYMMFWATDPAGPTWLIAHGADPNRAWGPDHEAPLHVAARRWDVTMVETLVTHGADVSQRRADGCTPHTLAELAGHREIAEWLLAHGATDELSELERFVACCARGDQAAADAMLAARPSLRSELRPQHHRMLDGPAESGDAKVLATMLACGFDPHQGDKDQVTPLHRAAMAGHIEAVRTLLAHGASVTATDGMFSASPLIWAVEGRRCQPRADDGHVEVARALIAAGSPVDWTAPEGAPNVEQTVEGLLDLRRAAASA